MAMTLRLDDAERDAILADIADKRRTMLDELADL
jgi:hypothetical protein